MTYIWQQEINYLDLNAHKVHRWELRMNQKLKIAVLVECHPFDIMKFQEMLWSFEDCECYVQALDLFVQDVESQDKYDAVLYYNMSLSLPENETPLMEYLQNKLGRASQGIILLHHALLSFPKWDLWTQVSGVRVRCEEGFEYHQNEIVHEHMESFNHPIVKGITDFSITDETYIIGEPEEPGNEIILTTNNAASIQNIGWTRMYQNSRVFCYASGHDNQAYGNASFREILHNGILWVCNKI